MPYNFPLWRRFATRPAIGHFVGKYLSVWLSASNVSGLVISCLCFFPFDVSDGRCGIIVSIPDHCLPFYFDGDNCYTP